MLAHCGQIRLNSPSFASPALSCRRRPVLIHFGCLIGDVIRTWVCVCRQYFSDTIYYGRVGGIPTPLKNMSQLG